MTPAPPVRKFDTYGYTRRPANAYLTHLKSNQISRDRCRGSRGRSHPKLPARRPAIGNANARVTTRVKMPMLSRHGMLLESRHDLAIYAMMEIPALELPPPALPDIPSNTVVHSAPTTGRGGESAAWEDDFHSTDDWEADTSSMSPRLQRGPLHWRHTAHPPSSMPLSPSTDCYGSGYISVDEEDSVTMSPRSTIRTPTLETCWTMSDDCYMWDSDTSDQSSSDSEPPSPGAVRAAGFAAIQRLIYSTMRNEETGNGFRTDPTVGGNTKKMTKNKQTPMKSNIQVYNC